MKRPMKVPQQVHRSIRSDPGDAARHGDGDLTDACGRTSVPTVPDGLPEISVTPGATTSLWPRALGLGIVALAGGLCLAMPFWGDQALFTLYARELTQGAVLYRDVFDVKQPGIFLFYAAGGLLFGFTEIGIHLFELVWWLVFSVFTFRALPPYFRTSWGPALVPVFTIAVYYLGAGLLDFGQVEILVGFPLLVAWCLIDQADPTTRRGLGRYAAAGLAAAVVVLLKHLYLLIILAFLGYAGLRCWRRGVARSDLQRALGAFLIALVVPLHVGVAYFAAYGQLGRIWWAYFEMAPAAQLMTPRPLGYLLSGARRFMIGHAPLLILAAVGCVHVLRERPGPRLDLMMGMVLWGATGVIAFIVLQGWPEYKWPLFTIPVGILAVMGVEVLGAMFRRLDGKRRLPLLATGGVLSIVSFALAAPAPRIQTYLLLSVVAGASAGIAAARFMDRSRMLGAVLHVTAAALGVSIALAAISPVNKLRALMAHDFALTPQARTEFQRALNHSYRAADEDLDFLRSGDGLPGTLYVFGDPVLLLRANRPQAVPILGWGPEFLDRRAWQQLHSDLSSTLPPYIVVTPYHESVIRERYPAIMESIESRYDVAFVGASGTWYVIRAEKGTSPNRVSGGRPARVRKSPGGEEFPLVI